VGLEAGFMGGLEQADVALAGVVAETFQGGGADTPARRGGGADEGGVVVLVGDQAQIGDQVLDFRLVEERLAAGELVGHLGFAQGFLEQPGLVVAAIEDGVVGETGAVLELVGGNAHDHGLRFMAVVAAFHQLHVVAQAQFAPQILFVQARVVGDDAVGGAQDALAGTVVLGEGDDFQARIVFLEPAQVLHVGAAPGVDGLVVVAHGGEAPHGAGQQLQYLVLGAVGVLVFVNEQVAQPALPGFQGVRMLPEKPDWQADQVVEIHGLIGAQGFLVGQIGDGDLALALVRGGFPRGVGREQGILPVGDKGGGQAQAGLVRALEDIGQDLLGVGGVQDGEARFVAQPPGLGAQDVQTQGVEGGYGEAVAQLPGQQLADPFPHLPRRLVGEGDGGDMPGLDAALGGQVGDLARDHPGLARTGSGQHQQRAVQIFHGFALLRVEVGEHGER
jgi:hypothetical protein